jgi:hypothetical protein
MEQGRMIMTDAIIVDAEPSALQALADGLQRISAEACAEVKDRGLAPGPAWDAESERIDAEIAADREEALSPDHVHALARAERAESRCDDLCAQLERSNAANAILRSAQVRLLTRFVGARMMAGELTIEGATAVANAELTALNEAIGRVG